MTAKGLYDSLHVELGKIGAPSILLEEFNYFAQKAVNQTINKFYNFCEINQQNDDNLRVLKTTSDLIPVNKELSDGFEVYLPLDYVHLLSCKCVFSIDNGTYKCYSKGDECSFYAQRLTSDLESKITSNFYFTPKVDRAYYHITNINQSNDLPTNPINSTILKQNTIGTDTSKSYSTNDSNLPRTISLKDFLSQSTVDREIGVRYGNASSIRMVIKCGKDNRFKPKGVIIDYIKAPQTIKLTQEQINLVKDTSQILEFPDYVCQEITNELVTLVMANIADPRLQSQIAVQQSIGSPTQQQTNSKN